MDEVLAGLVFGLALGGSVGWFLRSAMLWRRDARRAREAPQPVASPAPVVAQESRTEKLLERISQRMETLEDRVEFAERLLDARSVKPRAELDSKTAVHEAAAQR